MSARGLDPDAVRASYDAVAEAYAEGIFDELDGKPFDRAFLTDVARRAPGPVLDVGCGPGHVTAFLAAAGADAAGVDLSPGMVAVARQRCPGLRFEVADMRALTARDLGGIVCFYSLIHIPPAEWAAVLRGFREALRPGGLVAVAGHIGDHLLHLEDWWGHAVDVSFQFMAPERLAEAAEDAGLLIESVQTRGPYPEVEHPSQRVYLLARRG